MGKRREKRRAVDDFAWQEYDREEFKENFPALYMELENEGIPIEGYRKGDLEDDERDFSGYNPTIIDFLRRCETDEEALEIINWMESREEITPEMAKELRIMLVKKGVRTFGPKKDWGWYERHRKRE